MTPTDGFLCSHGNQARRHGMFLTFFLRKSDLTRIGKVMMAFKICGISTTCALTLRVSNFFKQQGMLLVVLPPQPRLARLPTPPMMKCLSGLVQGDADTTATTCNSILPRGNRAADISHAKDIMMLPAQHGCHAVLQVALDKNCDYILCLLW